MKEEKSSPDKHSERPSKKHEDENPDKRNLNPNDPYEETGLPIKKMSITGGPHHPHNEEILDSTSKKAVTQSS